MFERTLQDLIRGLRAHKASSKAQEDAFLAEAMVEIRNELKGKDMALKAEGIIKTCYVSGREVIGRLCQLSHSALRASHLQDHPPDGTSS
jgi:hypothetical protein